MDIKEYILAAAELELGDELFIPCTSRRARKKTLTKVLNLTEEYTSKVNVDVNFEIKPDFRDGKYWILIKRVPLDRAFFVKVAGETRKKIIDDPKLRHIIRLMREDKIPEEDIKEYVRQYHENQ